MEHSKVVTMAEAPHEGIMEWFKSVQFFAVALIIPLWRAIDKYFEYQSKKDREFIKSVVEESISASMRELKEDMKEIRAAQESDRKDTRRELTELIKQVNRHSS